MAFVTNEPGSKTRIEVQNPVLRTQQWQRMLALDPKLSLRRLAEREGIVALAIVQVFQVAQTRA